MCVLSSAILSQLEPLQYWLLRRGVPANIVPKEGVFELHVDGRAARVKLRML